MSMKMIRLALIGALIATLSLQVACRRNQVPDQPPVNNTGGGGGGGGGGTTAAPAPQTKSVIIYKYKFNPNSLTLPVGSTVVFKNKDPEQHNVHIKDLNVDRMLKTGESFSVTFSRAGSFTVTNRVANTPMKAVINVR